MTLQTIKTLIFFNWIKSWQHGNVLKMIIQITKTLLTLTWKQSLSKWCTTHVAWFSTTNESTMPNQVRKLPERVRQVPTSENQDQGAVRVDFLRGDPPVFSRSIKNPFGSTMERIADKATGVMLTGWQLILQRMDLMTDLTLKISVKFLNNNQYLHNN